MQYFVVMIDYGRRGREAVVDPEITRREVISRVASGEYKNISFIHEIADSVVDDITAEILAEAALPEIPITGADLQASRFDHARDLRKAEAPEGSDVRSRHGPRPSAPATGPNNGAQSSTLQRPAHTRLAKWVGSSERRGGRGVFALQGFLRLVVPHLGFSKQSPALEGMKHRALTAQGFHCAVANEIFHIAPPTPTQSYLRPFSRQSHYDSENSSPVREPTSQHRNLVSIDGTSAARERYPAPD